MVKNYTLKIFCDFDGTITMNDIWKSCLSEFINDKKEYENIINEFNEQVIGAKECIKKLLLLIENFSFDRFNKLLDAQEIDPFFKNFVDFCRQNEIDVTVVSGGFDYYIDYIFQKENISLPFYSSKLNWEKTETGLILDCEFPFDDEHCSWCETSKRNILVNNTNDLGNEISVYIGDSISDYCVVNYADMVFAKGKLASYCWKNNITYFDYGNFDDVIKKISKLLEKKNMKHRREAMIRRRDVFMGG